MCRQVTSLEDAERILGEGWDRRNCIFRGQSKGYPLIPKLGRCPEHLASEGDIITNLREGYIQEYKEAIQHSDFNVDPQSLFEQLGNDERQRWEKLIIPPSAKNEIRQTLNELGITRTFLFPSLDGLCQTIMSCLNYRSSG